MQYCENLLQIIKAISYVCKFIAVERNKSNTTDIMRMKTNEKL